MQYANEKSKNKKNIFNSPDISLKLMLTFTLSKNTR